MNPNPWLKRPDVQPIHNRYFGPLITFTSCNVPRLFDICANLLLTPRPPSGLPPMLDSYDWTPSDIGSPHPLLSSAALRDWISVFDEKACPRILQAMRSASNTASRKASSYTHGRRASTSANIGLTGGADIIPKTRQPPRPDDAADNPYYQACPNRRHLESTSSEHPLATKRLFLHAGEERLEWRTICGQANLPIKWLGCSPGCLDFLEQDDDVDPDDELWGLSEDEG